MTSVRKNARRIKARMGYHFQLQRTVAKTQFMERLGAIIAKKIQRAFYSAFGVTKAMRREIAQERLEREVRPTHTEDGRFITPYSDFAEGDYVMHNLGGAIHLVSNMAEDGFGAFFTCVEPNGCDIFQVGEVESNLCRRYHKVDYTPVVSEVTA